MDHLEAVVAEQAVAEAETGVGYVRRDGLVGAKGQEPALPVPLLDQAKGEAWRLGGEVRPERESLC